MKIIITKEEAINAWKEHNKYGKGVVVEIENDTPTHEGTINYPIPYVGDILQGTGGTILCGDNTTNNK